MLEKSVTHAGEFHVNTYEMQQMNNMPGLFDGIYCIGNTLVHLNNTKEIVNFIRGFYWKLKENGKLIIQIINYEKVLAGNDFNIDSIMESNPSIAQNYLWNINFNLYFVFIFCK